MQNQISQTYNQILQEKGDIMKKYVKNLKVL